MRNTNRARELIITGNDSQTKLRQFVDYDVKAWNKARRTLTTELENLDPASIESGGTLLQEGVENAREVLGEIGEFLWARANDAPSAQTEQRVGFQATISIELQQKLYYNICYWVGKGIRPSSNVALFSCQIYLIVFKLDCRTTVDSNVEFNLVMPDSSD